MSAVGLASEHHIRGGDDVSTHEGEVTETLQALNGTGPVVSVVSFGAEVISVSWGSRDLRMVKAKGLFRLVVSDLRSSGLCTAFSLRGWFFYARRRNHTTQTEAVSG
jgi:hypothetical protein